MMKKCVLSMLVLVMSVIVSVSQATIITNGSFDEGTETTGYVSGDSKVTGWSHNGGANCAMYHVNRNISDAYFPMAAPDTGSYYAGISASYIKNAYLYLYQTLGTMEIGQEYEVSGYVNNGGAIGTQAYGYWQVKVGTTVLGTGELNNTWQHFSFSYTATSTAPTLYLGYVDDESAGGTRSSVLYDLVTVEVVPEPISLVLIGLGSVMFRRRLS